MLRPNQIEAIQTSLENNFESGVHFQATGAGKSRIALELILKYNEKYPNKNILWLCEKKSILISQFGKEKLNDYDVKLRKQFLIINLLKNKKQLWYDIINSSQYWNKSLLIIINRALLTFNENYRKIKIPIHFIIHDECHTIVNQSTKLFYEYIQERSISTNIIGFSATPPILKPPFENILSTFSIYDGIKSGIIVPPQIEWIKSLNPFNEKELINIIEYSINKLYYKKIIVWCGMIQECLKYADRFSKFLSSSFKICMDTSKGNYHYSSFQEFESLEKNGILLCANKHREGSDITNLDGCIFLDKVESRYYKTFVQCIGRVLRSNQHKQYGFIMDLNAKHATEIIERMNMYLNIPLHKNPWKITYEMINDSVQLNRLHLDIHQSLNCKDIIISKKEELISFFKKSLKSNSNYKERLQYELELFEQKNLIGYLMKAIEILNITKHIPHITRGSCGSSLVCYLLGISHVDPIKYNVKFSRFLNQYRNSLPDIDFDFPYNQREDVFFKIELQWPSKTARISNHVYYHDKSAIRKVLSEYHNGFISKEEMPKIVKNIENKLEFNSKVKKLKDTFRYYSLHCGGIVFYPEGIPNELILKHDKKKKIMSQITLNKYEISNLEKFKIDILSSRGLAQLNQVLNNPSFIDFENFELDDNVFQMLQNGNNIGITFAESPLIKKAFYLYQPKSILDVAKCLSIIRPGAKYARLHYNNDNNDDNDNNDNNDVMIFDDDAITLIQKLIHCNEDEADRYRRIFSKQDKTEIKNFENLLEKNPQNLEILKQLKNLHSYSFCKAHAISYAQLIYALAYVKYHYPKKFWKSTLLHCHSMYKKWVHITEAHLYQIKYEKKEKSIYSQNHFQKMNEFTIEQQLRKYGFWNIQDNLFYPNCYLNIDENEIKVRGIIGTKRLISSNKLILFIGYDFKKYLDCVILNPSYHKNMIGVEGSLKLLDITTKEYELFNYKFF